MGQPSRLRQVVTIALGLAALGVGAWYLSGLIPAARKSTPPRDPPLSVWMRKPPEFVTPTPGAPPPPDFIVHEDPASERFGSGYGKPPADQEIRVVYVSRRQVHFQWNRGFSSREVSGEAVYRLSGNTRRDGVVQWWECQLAPR